MSENAFREELADLGHEHVHLHLHIDQITVVVQHPPAKVAGAAVTAILTIGDSLMSGTLSIDDLTKTAKVNYVDDKGDTDAAGPAGAVVTFAALTPTVSVDPATGKVTPVSEGPYSVGATIADAAGAPILEPDGVTPFTLTPVDGTVVAGVAVAAELSLA